MPNTVFDRMFGYRDMSVWIWEYLVWIPLQGRPFNAQTKNKSNCPNTLSQTPYIVKHPYTQIECLDNTTNKSVCQAYFKSPAKMGGDNQTPIDQTLYKTYKGYSQIDCLGKGLFG